MVHQNADQRAARSMRMGSKNRASILVDWLATSHQWREVARLPVERASAVVEDGGKRALSAQA